MFLSSPPEKSVFFLLVYKSSEVPEFSGLLASESTAWIVLYVDECVFLKNVMYVAFVISLHRKERLLYFKCITYWSN